MAHLTPYIIDIPKIEDCRGNLSVLDKAVLPFDVVRTYWINVFREGVPKGCAYYTTQEIIVALSGTVKVVTTGSGGRNTFMLDRPDKGLFLPSMTWREISGTHGGAVLMAVASTLYAEDDYINDFEVFNNIIASEYGG